MANEDKNQDVAIDGSVFKRVKMGLDEREVIPFIQNLIAERNELAKRQENTPTLARFIEKLAKEADEWAVQTKKEAREQAIADSRAILLKAEEKAAQYIEEKKTEANEQAAIEAGVIISNAEDQAAKYLEEKRRETIEVSRKEADFIKHQAQIQVEAWVKEIKENLVIQLRGVGGLLTKELRAQSEDLKRRAAGFENDFEKQLADLRKREITIYTDGSAVNQVKPAPVAEQPRPTSGSTGGGGGLSSAPLTHKGGAGTATATAYTLVMEETARETKWLDILIASGEADDVAALKIRLEQQSEIGAAQITRDVDRMAISIFLRKPVDLIQRLMSFPEVKQAQEVVENDQLMYKVVLARALPKDNMRDSTKDQLRDWNNHS